MYHFFIETSQLNGKNARILGEDVNHIVNVLRMKIGDKLLVNAGEDWEYLCTIKSIEKEEIILEVEEEHQGARELNVDITLYQGIPKSDKMELIIQKAVELGVKRIVPVMSKRVIVKLDEKKEKNKLERWQSISKASAKQSKRNIIPKIENVLSFKEAILECKDFEKKLIAYELSDDMKKTKEILNSIRENEKIAIFIGPEGGFEADEVNLARKSGFYDISLGKRILRTETAGFVILSNIMLNIEGEQLVDRSIERG